MKADKTGAITSEEFDRRFDEGEDLDEFIDWERAKRPNLETQRVNVDFPRWMLEALDAAAARLAIPRQAIIKMWIDDRLRREREGSV